MCVADKVRNADSRLRCLPLRVLVLVSSIMGEQGPDDARVLVRERYRSDVRVSPSDEIRQPSRCLICTPFGMQQHRTSAVDE